GGGASTPASGEAEPAASGPSPVAASGPSMLETGAEQAASATKTTERIACPSASAAPARALAVPRPCTERRGTSPQSSLRSATWAVHDHAYAMLLVLAAVTLDRVTIVGHVDDRA